jgi:hypothetical protein
VAGVDLDEVVEREQLAERAVQLARSLRGLDG